MAYKSMTVGGVDLMIDTSTGALLCVLGATPTIDIGEVSILNAAGTVINPATEDTLEKLTTPGTADTPALKSVTNASQSLAAANASRKMLVIRNNSTAGDLHLRLAAAAASANSAYVAEANGGEIKIPGTLWAGEVRGILSAADATANNVSVSELV